MSLGLAPEHSRSLLITFDFFISSNHTYQVPTSDSFTQKEIPHLYKNITLHHRRFSSLGFRHYLFRKPSLFPTSTARHLSLLAVFNYLKTTINESKRLGTE